MRDENIAMPGNETCGSLQKYFSTLEAVSNKCLDASGPTGSGLDAYCCPRANQSPCDFCNGGVTAPDTVTFPDPGRCESSALTCRQPANAQTCTATNTIFTCDDFMTFTRGFMQQGEETCTGLQAAMPLCCPSDSVAAPAQIPESGGGGSQCPFCPGGVSAEKASEAPPEAAGATCTELTLYAATLGDGSSDCSNLQFLEPSCCPTEDVGEVEDATEDAATGETTAEEDLTEESAAEDTTAEVPAADEPAADEEPAAEDLTQQEGAAEPAAEEEDATEEPAAEDTTAEEPAADEDTAAEDATQQEGGDGPAGEGAAEPASEACGFCPGGVDPDAAGAEVPGSGGSTCADLAAFAGGIGPGGDCDAVVLAEPLCCPGGGGGDESVRNFFEALEAGGN